jgi:hypothetical protein
MVLVDVFSQDPANGLPLRDLKEEDFRVFDDRRGVPIASFASGARYLARPLMLWLVVLCNEGGKLGGSKEFAGKELFLLPVLDHLDKRDTVGVAHWCDNGDARLDLFPTKDHDSPIRVLAETLKPISFHVGANSYLLGEDTYRKMVRLILQDAYHRNPQPLPVILFLDSDYTVQRRHHVDQVVADVLETSGIVFGIKDDLVQTAQVVGNGELGQVSHYMAEKTGGQYFSVPPQGYAAALDMILTQLHFRYELGFVPSKMDGAHHEVRVELTKEAREKYKGVQLRFRPEYVPVREEPAWAR